MNKKNVKLKKESVKALDRKPIGAKDDPEEAPRDWHSMSEEERMEILSHLSDMPFQ
ncbi:conserved hypothetical protein [Vibrio crassostreae]|uniref:hypothetical protein n=1 Tax=Vibrio crassostreae TaxID=246167 RepID=UPI000FAFB13F|nr:hypothetical protein [Vibrio crassostreae]RPF18958.1 hypothetical protein EDB12_1959 [Vibrio crassostreae]CAK2853349.1 conserved hypothetical protein [Vibrio crassostreae]